MGNSKRKLASNNDSAKETLKKLSDFFKSLKSAFVESETESKNSHKLQPGRFLVESNKHICKTLGLQVNYDYENIGIGDFENYMMGNFSKKDLYNIDLASEKKMVFCSEIKIDLFLN